MVDLLMQSESGTERVKFLEEGRCVLDRKNVFIKPWRGWDIGRVKGSPEK